ncbi:MAG: phosphatidylglycerophosphatase A [Desulfovibrionaceae bacterium]
MRRNGLTTRLGVAIATLGPVGHLPWAPGTWGSAAATLLAPLCFIPLPDWGRGLVLLGVLALGTWAAGVAERFYGRTDPGCVVIDEVLGLWIAVWPVPRPTLVVDPEPWTLLAGLVLFRIFDILKPWPIRTVERRTPGGLGVMLDDAVAGVLAALCLAAGRWAVRHWL